MSRIRKSCYKIPYEVSWVGECPWTNTLCFGAEDGKFVLVPPSSFQIGEGKTNDFELATDAINAIAFSDKIFALSSRNEVVVGKQQSPDGDGLDLYSHGFVGGAHGVVASHTGAFLAPIGSQGLLMMKIDDDCHVSTRIACHQDVPFNFYKLVRLGNGPNGEEVFASAGRHHGMLAFSFSKETFSYVPGILHNFEGHDIVDVCPLNDPHNPLAAVCVSRNRAIFLTRNVLEDQRPLALDFAGLQGTAYTLLSAQGHLLLLTDRDLLALPNVGPRFLRGESLDHSLEIRITPVKAAEAFLWRNQAVLLIEEESTVSELMVADLVGTLADKHAEAALARNGSTSPESSIEVTSVMNSVQVIRIQSGWLRTSEFGLTSTPAA